ncbi:hypothetical protein [Rhodobacter maris]|uniref:Uncharacterized protein n=1 Tax=Rhodobacter maris TaxID=446682 RepID=A0A285TF55_9RHOB|nr:hypothetical protein [Rhodobacter maris]SOC20587.1 hypothetical protein SAMN05877831_1204 [Rhodobacter maris]
MAYSFPLSTADFMDILPIEAMTCDLPEVVETSITVGGDVLQADLGAWLWQGEIKLDIMQDDEAERVIAMLDVVRRGGSFFCYSAKRRFPRADLSGTGLGAATPVLSAVSADMCKVELSGLPSGYRLRFGDMLSFSYGVDPTRYALHRIAGDVSASAAGKAAGLVINPPIRSGFTLGAAVSLVKASCKAIIVPNSLSPGTRKSTITSGMSFRWMQTLR